ncbi:MAG: T9SS type A sorting domain-containing protein [Dysgonamonadaceae bacterium]|jgi:hypothetical protein|nr:T9SS type A sorting domain-containing protein [Dysgonamonadaceae bacterium]
MKSKILIAGFALLSCLFFAGITTVKSSDLFFPKRDGSGILYLQEQQILPLSPAGVTTVEVSVVALPAGVYFLRATNEAGNVSPQSITSKIIKK